MTTTVYASKYCLLQDRIPSLMILRPQNRRRMAISLFVATALRTGLVILSYGCKVPAGIFVPSIAVGASFGRMVGILVQSFHETFPDSGYFAACEPDVPCITPGTYAFLGAAAALSGIMHITVSVTVIMFELTGALTYILPTMIVVGVTKAVGDRFGKGGIADRMIWFNGFPFLDNKEDHSFGVPVSEVMTSNVTALPAQGLDIRAAEKLLNEKQVSGFPIVEDRSSMILLGYIGHTELRYALEKARKGGLVSANAKCLFISQGTVELQTPASINPIVSFDDEAIPSAGQTVDFSNVVDRTPLSVHPRLPLETVMELFKKMGPRVILVDHHGRLTGLVTVKDCLKYQFQVEHQENAQDDQAIAHDNETFIDIVQHISDWFAERISFITAGRLRLSPRMANGWSRGNGHVPVGGRHDILEGTEDLDSGVELEHR